MSPQNKQEELFEQIHSLHLTFSNDLVHELSAKWQEYVNSLNPEDREDIILIMNHEPIPVKEIPKLIREKPQKIIPLLNRIFGWV